MRREGEGEDGCRRLQVHSACPDGVVRWRDAVSVCQGVQSRNQVEGGRTKSGQVEIVESRVAYGGGPWGGAGVEDGVGGRWCGPGIVLGGRA